MGTLAMPVPSCADASQPAASPGQLEDARLERDLQHALAHDGLMLHFQPRVCLASRRIVGAEALARWPHRRRGMVPPAVFVPIAERSQLIDQLGGWALSAACRQAVRWGDAACVSVNVSPRQLAGGLLMGQLRTALGESGLAPQRLELELTESMLVEASVETLLILSEIRDLGLELALDDFGTGYASLSALKRLPLTTLKLDRSFLRGVPRHAEDTAIAAAVVNAGRALHLTIVAEGIMDEAQARFLQSLGCDQGQAYFFGRPAPAERFRQSLIAQESA